MLDATKILEEAVQQAESYLTPDVALSRGEAKQVLETLRTVDRLVEAAKELGL